MDQIIVIEFCPCPKSDIIILNITDESLAHYWLTFTLKEEEKIMHKNRAFVLEFIQISLEGTLS